MEDVVKVLMEALVPTVVMLLGGLIVQLLKRVNLSISAEQTARVEQIATNLILTQEEKAAAAAKEGLAPVGDKLHNVVTQLLVKIPNITAAEAEDIVHAQLPKIGAGAAATFRAIASAATSK